VGSGEGQETADIQAAADKLRAYDYQGALKSFDEGFANAGSVFNGSEPEYIEANSFAKKHMPKISS